MKKSIIPLLLSITLLPFSLLAQNPNSNAPYFSVFHIQELVEIPCTGDIVMLEGDILLFSHGTFNDQHSSYKYFIAPRNLIGTNTRTGQKCFLVGSSQSSSNWLYVNDKHSVKGVFHFNYIGQGKDANYYQFELFIQSYDRNGELVLDIDKIRTECR